MFCENCGKNIGDASVCPFCNYGADPTPVEPTPPAYTPTPVEQATPAYNPTPAEPAAPTYTPASNDAPTPPAYQSSYPYQQQMPDRPAPQPYPLGSSIPTPTDTPKKSKKKILIPVIIGIVVLLIGGGVAAFFLTAPMRSYNHAMGLKEEGNYDEAITEFTELGDYSDSADQITDCKYLKAKKMLSDKKFEDAIKAFEKLGSYKDSKDQITAANYGIAQKLLDDGEYKDAKSAFNALGDYKDSADKIKYCDYMIAKDMITSDPSTAISAFEKLGTDYEDCAQLIKDAKMSYCKKNKNNYNTTTYKYLTELVKAKYTGAAALYKELYTWRLTKVFWNTDNTNNLISSKKTTISNKNDIVLHFSLEGGKPNESVLVYYTLVWTSGKVERDHYDKPSRNYTLTLKTDGTGTIKVALFTSTKQKLGTYSIKVTN